MFRVIHHNRWFFWAIAAVLIAGLVLAVLFLSADREFHNQAQDLLAPADENPSDSVYQGWHTLRPEGFGISIKYPPSWQVEVDPLQPHSFNLQPARGFSENIAVSLIDPATRQIVLDSIPAADTVSIEVDGRSGVWLKNPDNDDPALGNVVFLEDGSRVIYLAGQSAFFEKIARSILFQNQ